MRRVDARLVGRSSCARLRGAYFAKRFGEGEVSAAPHLVEFRLLHEAHVVTRL
jgi:hypothetical protein